MKIEMKATVTLTREEHDKLLTVDQPLLSSLFEKASGRFWTLAGVEIIGVPVRLAEEAKERLGNLTQLVPAKNRLVEQCDWRGFACARGEGCKLPKGHKGDHKFEGVRS